MYMLCVRRRRMMRMWWVFVTARRHTHTHTLTHTHTHARACAHTHTPHTNPNFSNFFRSVNVHAHSAHSARDNQHKQQSFFLLSPVGRSRMSDAQTLTVCLSNDIPICVCTFRYLDPTLTGWFAKHIQNFCKMHQFSILVLLVIHMMTNIRNILP